MNEPCYQNPNRLEMTMIKINILTWISTAAVDGPQFDHTVTPTRGKAKPLDITAGSKLVRIVGYLVDSHVMSAELANQASTGESVEDHQLTSSGAGE